MSLWREQVACTFPTVRIKDVADLVNGFPFDAADFNEDEGTPVIRIRDLLRGRTETLVRGAVPPSSLVRRDDLVVGMDGDFNSRLWPGPEAALNQRLCLLRARPTAMDQRFLAYFIGIPLRAINEITFFTTVKHLSSADLLAERVPMPGIDEQRRIADFLDVETARIDALIAAKQQMIETLAQARPAIIQHGVVGIDAGVSVRTSGVPWAPELPSHWAEAKLTLLAQLGSGHTPSRSRPEWWLDPTVPWITTGEVAQMRSDRIEQISETREKLSELGIANSSAVIHPAGTVVLCRTAASAGYSAIMAGDMAVSQDIATWTCGPRLRPRYLLLCLRAMRRDLLERLAMGSTHKTIYMPDLESLRVPVPPIAEQDAIVESVWCRLHRSDAITDTLTAQIGLLRERRQALITAAVTGEIEV